LRKYSTLNESIEALTSKLPSSPGFFRLDGEPYWLELLDGKKVLYYIYVLGKPPYRSMPSERFPSYSRTLRDGASALLGIANTTDADKLVVPEAMGFHVGGILSAMTEKPFIPVAKETGKAKRYVDDVSKREVEGRISIKKATGYAVTEMFVYGLEPGDKVVLIDTIISTGGTAVGIIKGLKEYGIEVLDFASYVTKVDYKGHERIREETGIEAKSLLDLRIKNVYEKEGRAYADTIVEKSKWWQKGEATYMKLKDAWTSFSATVAIS